MAPKRGVDGRFKSSGGSLTGGTGDVKPQQLTINVPTAGAGDDYSLVEVIVPRQVLSFSGIATVMEILQVHWYLGLQDVGDISNQVFAYLSFRELRTNGETSTIGTFATDLANSSTFAAAMQQSNQSGATGGQSLSLPITIDMTDNNGNGFLVATDKIFAIQGYVNNTVVANSVAKVTYRMVNVGLTEYVGIVQSQSV